MLDKMADQIERESDQAINGVVQSVYELSRTIRKRYHAEHIGSDIEKLMDAHKELGRAIERVHSEIHMEAAE